jgi:YD repeat-containing protein
MTNRPKRRQLRANHNLSRDRWTRSKYFGLTLILAFISTAWLASNFDPVSAQQPWDEQTAVNGRANSSALEAQADWDLNVIRQAQILNSIFQGNGGYSSEFEQHLFDFLGEAETPRQEVLTYRFRTHYEDTSYQAEYELGNQGRYSVSLGGLSLPVAGTRISLIDRTDNSVSMQAYSGFSTDPRLSGIDAQAWLKGYLEVSILRQRDGGTFDCGDFNHTTGSNALDIYRYSYHPPGGGRVIHFYGKPVEAGVRSFWTGSGPRCTTFTQDPLPRYFWSEDESVWLDVGDACKPVLHWADGSIEEMAPAIYLDDRPIPTSTSPPLRVPTCATSPGPLRFIDRNGNVNTYNQSGSQQILTDSRGRQTILTYEIVNRQLLPPFARLRTVSVPGPGGTTLNYQINWTELSVNLDAPTAFQDVNCRYLGGDQPCGSGTVDAVQSIQIPDGRFYQFEYGPWGNLTTAREPGGAVRKYIYGDASNTAYANASLPLQVRAVTTPTGYIWSGEMAKVQARGLKEDQVYPLGEGQGLPVNKTFISFERKIVQPSQCILNPRGEATAGPDACAQVWKVVTLPDGTVTKTGFSTRALPTPPVNPSSMARASGPVTTQEWEIGEETWTPQGSLVSATYYGDVAQGTLFYDFEALSTFSMPNGPAADRRPRKIVSIKDGVTSTTTLAYDDRIDIGAGNFRNTKNVTSRCIWAGAADDCTTGSGTKFSQTDTTYFHLSPYYDPSEAINRNILHLPGVTKVTDPARGLLTRTDYSYDQFTPAQSFAASLITDPTIIGVARGNLTTATSYRDTSSLLTTGVSTVTHYFDTGAVQQSKDPNGNTTSMDYDFGACSAANATLANTVTNAKGHKIITVSDCFTGLTLSVTDPNGKSVFTQYDNLGRAVETAGPGDTLTPIAGFTRDPNAPLNGGSAVGNNGQGPTSWIEYLSLGFINKQRTVTHAKDGTADGRYVTTFVDGLGRTIQTRSEIDPATSGGNSENVATTEYDNMGRVSKSYVPTFSSVASTSYAGPAAGVLATTTSYDALGRVLSVTPPGLPPSTATYGASGAKFLTTAVDANGNQTNTLTDVLGRTVQVSRQSDTCSDPILGNWCVTIMDYDAAGRLLQTTDPGSNRMSFIYDGLGRKTQMTDPDMGTWTYVYDDNGNLTKQTDAKGQVITMQYDALNRIFLKDLLPAGEGEEDITYFYDGDKPSTCYSCNDHCATTTDTCDAATGTCTHTGTPCDGAPPPPSAPAAPSNLTATADSTSQITLRWTDNSNNETGFKVERSTDGGATFSLLATVGAEVASYPNSGLTANTTYFYRVKATNGVGDSSPSNTVSATTQGLAPTVPGSLAATAFSFSRIDLTWTSSSNHTGYVLERSLTSGTGFAQIASPSASATTFSDTGVQPSTRYFYRIKATSGVQESGYSIEASALTPVAPPTVPGNLRVISVTNTTINVAWDDTANEASYNLQYEPLLGSSWTTIALGQNVVNRSVTGLQPNTSYLFQIQACNSNGCSAYSSAIQVSTDGPPDAPVGLIDTGATNTTISLSWSNVSNETGYTLERSPDGPTRSYVAIQNLGANITTYTDSTGLTANTNYWYRVKAFNTYGPSPYSAERRAGTVGPPVTPGNLRFTNVAPQLIGVAWDDVSNETAYVLERTVNSNAPTTISLGANVISYSETATANTTYNYRVLASNSNGPSPYSAAITATTPFTYYSLSLSGSNQWLEVPYKSSLDPVISPATSFTVEAWIKTAVDFATCGNKCPTQVVVSHFNPNSGTNNDGGYELWVGGKGRVNFTIMKNSTTMTTVSSTQSILPNKWYHIAGVYNVADPDNANQAALSLYVQGQRVQMNISPTLPRTSLTSQPFMIGRENVGTTNSPYFFNGKIDEVRFSQEAAYTGASYVFPGGDIEKAWGHLGNLTSTKGLWKFDNQDGRDTSANLDHNNPGTVQGGPLFNSDVPGGQPLAAVLRILFPQLFADWRWTRVQPEGGMSEANPRRFWLAGDG